MIEGLDDHELVDLPGGERALRGLRALEFGEVADEVLWLQIASSRLGESGVRVPPGAWDVHLELRRRCQQRDPLGGHATYKALEEELVSFLDGLEAKLRRSKRAAGRR